MMHSKPQMIVQTTETPVSRTTPAFDFVDIDWQAPWWSAVAARGQAALACEDWRQALSAQAVQAALVSGQGRALCFVAQEELPAETAYEAFIAATGRVPTRRNLHDFFNALIWLTYPRGKAALNARQAAAIAADGVRATRGATQPRCSTRTPCSSHAAIPRSGPRCGRSTGRRCSWHAAPSGGTPARFSHSGTRYWKSLSPPIIR
ncbi:membrane protein [Pandoraea anhela]|uniref:Membrane protein n=1 Tax=Pandoraea anhela TaxID=2508295 RepID=A0A5E4WYQ8_9BURK|nr:membrane protein [Pandoraea anhela]